MTLASAAQNRIEIPSFQSDETRILILRTTGVLQAVTHWQRDREFTCQHSPPTQAVAQVNQAIKVCLSGMNIYKLCARWVCVVMGDWIATFHFRFGVRPVTNVYFV